MESYKNRKKMLTDYSIDFVAPQGINKKELMELVNTELNNIDVYNVDNYRIDVVALSFGMYGMNGGVFSVSESGNMIDTQLVFAVDARSTLLFELV